MPTNEERAERVRPLLEEYVAQKGEAGMTDSDEAITDLVVDLLHLAEADGVNYESILRRAENHVEVELHEGGAL